MTENPAPSGEDMRAMIPISVSGWARLFTRWDVLAVLLILGLLVFLAEASRHLFEPLAELEKTSPSLDPRNLPEYAARTTLRMLIAMVLSLLFTFTYATLAAKSKRAERLLVPLLDILQSVPILGFISVTVVFFMALAPGRVLGAEYAAIFAIFTSQAWNMAFSFYQSLRTIPTELDEAARNFRLSPWMKFWRLDVPFAMPQLIWNMMMSMSGSWFFVVASEAISVGNTTITLPGVGSYIALAIERQDLRAVAWAIATMLIVILIYDQLLFRPLVAWADRFRFEQEAGVPPPRSWVFDVLRRSRVVERLRKPFGVLWRLTLRPRRSDRPETARRTLPLAQSRIAFQFGLIVVALAAAALWQIVHFVIEGITLSDVGLAILLGFATLARVTVLIAIASVIWVPIGVWVGTRPHAAHLVQPVAQFLAAFPANLLFPVVVSLIVAWRLDPNIWLSPLMILGTQWYILFNVIAGAAAIPAELRAVGANLRVRGWLWWRRIA
ncbi:MAG: ABC transporter permease subunit, partial [Xanthobacteraceae bacterium]